MPRKKNPLFDPISREIESAVGGSMVVVDQWFDEMEKLRSELLIAEELQANLENRIIRHKKEGWTSAGLEGEVEDLKAVKSKISSIKREMKIVDRRIAEYYKAALRDISERLDTIKALPGSGMYAREYRDAMRMFALAKKQAQFAHVDVRPKISQLRGAVKTLEDATRAMRPTGLEVSLAGSRGRLRPKKPAGRTFEDAVSEQVARWKALRVHAKSTPEYKSGLSKVSELERRGDDPQNYRGNRSVDIALSVKDIDLLLDILKRRVARGEPGQERNLKNLKSQIDLLSSKMGEGTRRRVESPEAVISKIGKLRRDLLVMRKGTRKSPKDMEKMRERLEKVSGLVGVKGTKGWSEQDRRTAGQGIRDAQALLESMERVTLPSRVAQRLGMEPTRKHRVEAKAISKRSGNPKRKAGKSKKVGDLLVKPSGSRYAILSSHVPSGPNKGRIALGYEKTQKAAIARARRISEISEDYGEFKRSKKREKLSPEALDWLSKNPKKKTAKKKAKKKRATTSESQRMVRRCQKLWDHYCQRPGKKRLQDVLKHLEKMKASKSKKVLDERGQCLRVANAEAKRLRLK